MRLYNILLALQRWQIDPVVHERLFTLVLGLIGLLVLSLLLSARYTPAGKYFTVTSRMPFLARSPYRFVRDDEQGLWARIIRQGWGLPAFLINTPFYRVDGPFDPIEIPVGSFGVLIANEGKPIPPGRQASAKQFTYEEYLDGQDFLERGGERGPQAFVLGPGPHFLHRGLFTYQEIKPLAIPTGYIGVLLCKVGDDPKPDEVMPVGSQNKGGQPVFVLKPRDQRRPELLRGIEAEVLLPGEHVINPYTHELLLVDTTPTRLRVNGTTETTVAGAPTKLDPVSVITSDGFGLGLEAEIVIQVLPDQAPAVIALGGSYTGFVHEVVVPYLDHIMKAAIAQVQLKNFIQNLDKVREIIEIMLRAALEGRVNALAALSDNQKNKLELMSALDNGAQVDQRENYPVRVNTFRFLAQDFGKSGSGVRELLQQLEAVSIAREEVIARVEQLKVAEQDTEIAKQHALAQAAEIVQEARLRSEASNFDVEVIKKRLEALAPILEQAGSLGQVSQGILAALIGSQLNPELMAMVHAYTDEKLRRPDQLPAAINPGKSAKTTTL